MDLKIFPPEQLSNSIVALPLSKSESNRQLIITALTKGADRMPTVADCDDSDAVQGAIGIKKGIVNIGAAGTAMRFLTAYFACTPGTDILLDGSERMRQRPIGPLVDALRSLGADIDYAGEEGFPPLQIRGRMLEGGDVEMDATVSSQFVSALLMVAPKMQHGLRLRLSGDIVSTPYIKMTLSLMASAGASSEFDEDSGLITVPYAEYHTGMPPVEADWSAASYWFEIAAISTDPIALKGLRRKSLQGDASVRKLFEVTGLQSEFDSEGLLQLQLTPDAGSQLIVDLSDNPDLAQTLAVTCCLLALPFRLEGLQSLRIKETDRIAALQMELSKLGFVTDATADGALVWLGAQFDPGEEIEPIATYQDHRMAMAFAPAALFFPGLQINNAEVVSKSYPQFWNHLRAAGFTIDEVDA
ncbi:MAG: 3-phosphoshikimate 1-carboxyvinyltransferase [Bacteroides sp.]|nr:3-phosphoshikimate 1-carboxyvinyltransferase [Bacteroides sp.]MCM1378477.1 3-phosphoshikimate 1-carboxyvinyltransferase [Bacteroides sp.]MCM1444778.1 3-phosphoshikimate 1-carboxyvinyltransferase [Prevotella sp.]